MENKNWSELLKSFTNSPLKSEVTPLSDHDISIDSIYTREDDLFHQAYLDTLPE